MQGAVLAIGDARGRLRQAIRRRRLEDLVLDAAEPIVLIEGAAGLGKSVLLRQLADRLGLAITRGDAPAGEGPLVLWDLDNATAAVRLPEPFIEGEQRLVVARRPGQRFLALPRDVAYLDEEGND